jgi:Fe-S-cluster containining protein
LKIGVGSGEWGEIGAGRMPVFYECQRCTACCRWPGQVRVTDAEITRMAEHLGLGEREFIERYMRLREDRRGIVLKDQPDGACVFLEGGNCRVQPVKPQQCRDFPNHWRFPGFERECRAVAVELGEEEYAARVLVATGRQGVGTGRTGVSEG